MDGLIRVLMIEDSEADAVLITRQLTKGGYRPELTRVTTPDAIIRALDEKKWDVIISDYHILPHFTGIDALAVVQSRDNDIPFIMVSGKIGEDLAVQAMKLGAHDYVMKDNLVRLVPVIQREIDEAEVRRERRRAEDELRASLEKLSRMMEDTITAVVRMVELKDPYTAGHQQRVAQLAIAIAAEMGFDQSRLEGMKYTAVLHDIGKISIPTELLSKPSRLSANEFNLIKEHSETGSRVLQMIDFPWNVPQIVLQHHERMDGSGYPQGLKGSDILLETRILTVSDVMEAMVSHRPYRPALGLDKALEEITIHQGQFYDSEVVKVCKKLFKQGFQFTSLS